jgi:two-component system response regulator FimZ (fimbrial Z protein)
MPETDTMPVAGPMPARCPVFLILDDHPAFRMGVRAIVSSRWKNAEIREASTVQEVCRILETGAVDLAILDQSVGSERGIDLVPDLVAKGCRVVVLSMSSDRLAMVQARRWGALGWIRKDESPAAILTGIEMAFLGRPIWSEAQVGLSPKEAEVLDAMYRRIALKDIAAGMGVTYSTLNTHKRRILSKLGLSGERDPQD